MGAACCVSSSASAPEEVGIFTTKKPLLTQQCPSHSQTLKGKTFRAFCTRVIDGDTVVLNVDVPGGPLEYHVRLLHTDSPELKSKDNTERQHAQTCRAFLQGILEKKHCLCTPQKVDNFGRLLADVFLRGDAHQSVTQQRVDVADVDPALDPPQNPAEQPLLFVNVATDIMLKWTSSIPYEGRAKETFHFDSTLKKYHLRYRDIYVQLH